MNFMQVGFNTCTVVYTTRNVGYFSVLHIYLEQHYNNILKRFKMENIFLLLYHFCSGFWSWKTLAYNKMATRYSFRLGEMGVRTVSNDTCTPMTGSISLSIAPAQTMYLYELTESQSDRRFIKQKIIYATITLCSPT